MRNFARTSSLAVLVAGATAAAHRAHAAEPTVSECLGANEKSIALRRESKLEAAREQLLVCAAASCPAEIRKECADRVERVNAAIPTIVFEVKDALGIDVVAVHLTVDGRPATDVKEGVALPLDPGTHTFQFEANGYLRSEKTLVLRQGEKDRRELITLAREPVKEARAATVPAALAPPASDGSSQTKASSSVSSRAPEDGSASRAARLRTFAFIAGGVGVVGIGVGSVLGLMAKRSYDASNDDDHCRSNGCDDKGLQYRDDAFKQARFSTAFFIGGAAVTAGAVGLYVVSRSQRATPTASRVAVLPLLASNGGGVALSGDF